MSAETNFDPSKDEVPSSPTSPTSETVSVAIATARQSDTFDFLNLPAEIRNAICAARVAGVTGDGASSPADHDDSVGLSPDLIALAQVNRQLRQECRIFTLSQGTLKTPAHRVDQFLDEFFPIEDVADEVIAEHAGSVRFVVGNSPSAAGGRNTKL